MNSEALTAALVDECHRQFENCRDTAVSFIVWLRALRWAQRTLIVAPIICGAIATWSIVADNSPVVGAVFALLATVLPPVYKASNLDETIGDYETLAGEFTNLRDRFRQLATISALKPFEDFDVESKPIFERMEKARARSHAPPNWTFKLARRKIEAGDYEHDYDERKAVGKAE